MAATQIFISGQFRNATSGKTMDVVNPATEEVIAKMAVAGQQDVNAAVESCKAAFESGVWALKSGAERAVVLRKLADLVRGRKEELARLETRDNGKPVKESLWDMDDVAGCFDYFAGQAEALDKAQDTPISLGDGASFTSRLQYFPVGVVAAITPWNYPMLMSAWKVAPALAAGCSVVLKPSELCPLTSLELVRIAAEAGVPAGVFNLLTGGGETGAALASHPGCNMTAFTGSVPTGLSVGAAAVRDLKKMSLELGGKSPVVVFDDADMIRAVEWVAFGVFWTTGQICSSTSRLLIQEKAAPKFIAALAALAQAIPIVDPNEPDQADKTGTLGPVVSRGQQQKILGMLERAKQQGARVVTGGRAPPGRARGFYIEPTILEVTPQMEIWREEVFGPVLSFMTFKTEEEAVRLANDTEFGLGGAVLSADKDRCARMVKALRCGIVWVNCSQPCFVNAPWGGCKRSGCGMRELGPRGIYNYLEEKQVTEHLVETGPLGWFDMTAAASKL